MRRIKIPPQDFLLKMQGGRGGGGIFAGCYGILFNILPDQGVGGRNLSLMVSLTKYLQ